MRLVAVLIVVLMILPAVYASSSSFTFSLSKSAIVIKQGEQSSVNVFINSTIDDKIALSMDGYQTWMTIYPVQPSITAGVIKNVTISLEPSFNTTPGTYALRLNLYSVNTKKLKSKPLYVTVSPEHEKKVYIENSILEGYPQPGGNVSIKVDVKNYKNVPVSNVILNVDILFSSEKIFNYQKIIQKLDPSEQYTVRHTFNFDKSTPWGNYVMNIKLIENSKIVGSDTKLFNIVKMPIITNKTVSETILFGYKKKIIFKNTGNYPSKNFEVTENVDKTFYNGMEPIRKNENKYVFLVPSLAPNESYIIEYDINYWPLVVIPVLIILLAIFLYLKLKGVYLRKFVLQKKEIKEGGEFTIGIEIKNKSGQEITNVIIRDFVPSVFKIKNFIGGSPVHKSSSVGTELTWRIKKMAKDEIRIVGYKIVPVFGVSGRVKLPKCSMVFKIKKTKKIKHSVRTNLGV